jgi:hypothetical protein
LSGQVLDRLLEAGNDAALDAEDSKELVPKRLGFGVFSGDAGPVLGKGNSVMSDFIPGNGHRFVSARMAEWTEQLFAKIAHGWSWDKCIEDAKSTHVGGCQEQFRCRIIGKRFLTLDSP